MTIFTRMLRSIRDSATSDAGFENYYGSLVRNQAEGGPTAAEARRDYRRVRYAIDRVGII